MKDSPFIYGKTVIDQSFINRRSEIRRLSGNLTGGINTCLISPRRWGKSSLVQKTAGEITANDKNIRVVSLDLFTVNSSEQFLEKFAREVIRASSKWQDWVKNARTFFKVLIPKIHIGIDPVNDFSLSFNWDEIRKHEDEILDLPERIAKGKKIRLIICIDEFQSIADYDNYESLEKMLRSVWQKQENVTYCLYGSRRHMMNNIFNNPSKPFYRFGDIMHLEKIARDEWISFISESFARTGKKIAPENAALIADLMQCHSWYVQQLAHYTWNLTAGIATRAIIEKALSELVYANTPFYQKESEIMSPTQINLLKAVLNGETKLTSVSAMSEYRLGTPRNVSKNKIELINDDIIQEGKGRLEFVDPAFELWFRQSFLNQPLPGLVRPPGGQG